MSAQRVQHVSEPEYAHQQQDNSQKLGNGFGHDLSLISSMKVDNCAGAARKTGRPHLINEGQVGMEGSVYQTARRLGRFLRPGTALR